MKCNHDLIPVYIESISRDEQNVVRWCTKCGAVVVDVDYDGRTMPGKIRKIQVPTDKTGG